MQTRNVLSAMSLPLVLGVVLNACAPSSVSTGELAGDRTPQQSQSNQSDRAQTTADKSKEVVCDRPKSTLKPLSTPENMPVFEQFNFAPQEISVEPGKVAVKTPYYTFSLCQSSGTKSARKKNAKWAIASTAPEPEEPFDYATYASSLADPEYETIEIDEKLYEYRVRLQATWLDEELNPTVAPSDVENGGRPPEEEESVYFDIKSPDGEVTSYELYTVEAVREASIGASLGVPRISGTAVTDDGVWFAATTSQGEGENGFASLLQYDPETEELDIQRPEEIQGDQITSMVATGNANTEIEGEDSSNLTLWLGTMRSGEGNPSVPANGLAAYRPATKTLNRFTLNNSPIVGAVPHQLAVSGDSLWVGTGNGICEVDWQIAEQADSWRCWRFATTAKLPSEGVALYPSFLAEESTTTLKKPEVEVLWAAWEFYEQPEVEPKPFRYEVVYEPGIEATLSQGGYRVNNEVAQRMVGDNPIFWPGRQWHWGGDKFRRTFDEVSLNLVGGGPYGLITSNIRTGFSFDHLAIRGSFDLLGLAPDGTKVRYYSGWVDGTELEVYPEMVAVTPPKTVTPNPLDAIAAELPASSGP